MLRRLITFVRDRTGSSAVEFAIILPGFLFLSMGALNFAIMMYGVVSLHQTTEAAARYARIQINANNGVVPSALTGSSTTAGSVAYFATNHYFGPGIGAVYTYTATGCGNTVSASGNYMLFSGVGGMTIPLTATACYP